MINAQYGISSAGLVLQKLLSTPENKRHKRRIGHLISELYETLYLLYSRLHLNRHMYDHLWNLVGKDFKERAKNKDLSENLSTHLQTTITGILRQKRREYMIVKGGLSKKQTDKLKEEYKKHYNEFVEKRNTYEKSIDD